MPNLLEAGATWLGIQLKQSAGTLVTYKRGVQSVALTVTKPAASRQINVGGEVVFTEYDVQEWIVIAADIVIGGIQVEPERGDRIVEATDATHHYELLPEQGLPPWNYMDGSRKMIRLRTKLTRVVDG